MNSKLLELQSKIKALEEENAILKQKQIEISKAKELYLKIFEDFPALIWRSGLDKLCDYFNKTWLEFTGRTYEQEFGNGWAEGVHPDDFDFCLQTYIAAFEKREAFLMEYRLKNKYGEYKWIRDFGQPFFDLDNTFLGYIGSCYDITSIKNNELKLIALNATKDKFFSIIAHDLKNPFNNILGNAELLCDAYDLLEPEKRTRIAKQLYQSAKSTYALLENLLEWSRSQSDMIPFKPGNVSFLALCHEVTESLQPIAKTKNIGINIPSGMPIDFFADVNMIKTVMRNLVSNAIKYTGKNGTISIHAEKSADSVLVKVSDSGVGIDSQILEKLFDISQKSSKAGTEGEKGTGLGLILCREFIEKHNGKIWVESELGKGSSFIFSLPVFNN